MSPSPTSTAGKVDGNSAQPGMPGRLGYNGQFHEVGTSWQLLGNGYRVYDPVLMRFHSPDSLSPFGAGGINAYAYCGGDPVNNIDPTGKFLLPLTMVAGLGALVMGAAATVSSLSGKEKAAVAFGAIAGLLGAAAMISGGVHVSHSSVAVRQRRPEVRFYRSWGRDGEVVLRRHQSPAGSSMSVLAHGNPYQTAWGRGTLDGTQLVQQVKAAGGDRVRLDFARLNSCYGGTGGRASNAQVLADGLGVPVVAYPANTHGGWAVSPVVTSSSRPLYFVPQSGIRKAASAVRNTELHRRARGLSTRRERLLM